MKQETNPKVVQEQLGHSSISVTLDVYSDVIPRMQELAAKRLMRPKESPYTLDQSSTNLGFTYRLAR